MSNYINCSCIWSNPDTCKNCTKNKLTVKEDHPYVFNTDDNIYQVYNSFDNTLYNMQMLCK